MNYFVNWHKGFKRSTMSCIDDDKDASTTGATVSFKASRSVQEVHKTALSVNDTMWPHNVDTPNGAGQTPTSPHNLTSALLSCWDKSVPALMANSQNSKATSDTTVCTVFKLDISNGSELHNCFCTVAKVAEGSVLMLGISMSKNLTHEVDNDCAYQLSFAFGVTTVG